MARRLLLVLGIAAVAFAEAPTALACHAASPGHFVKEEKSLAMDDGAVLAATLYLPLDYVRCDHSPVAAPAIMMFHGLGGSRRDMNLLAEISFARQGYVVLTFDTRGHGESAGLWSLVGPRELADYRALFQWLTARPDVDPARVGALGISLGGGAVWRSIVEGIPFAAVETVET